VVIKYGMDIIFADETLQTYSFFVNWQNGTKKSLMELPAPLSV